MIDSRKLTKKQRKGLAFRQKKGKGRADDPVEDVPAPEIQDDAGLESPDEVVPSNNVTQVQTTSKAKPVEDVGDIKPSKKRKRIPEEVLESGGGVERQRKKARDDEINEDGTKQDGGSSGGKEGKRSNSRFIVFVGNLKYTTSKEAILEHFSVCDPPPDVRLLTPKSSTSTKSKGCAFLEFNKRSGLQQALKLHQSELDGRKINVELTAGGGGKSEKRLIRLKERNKSLIAQRIKHLQKQHTEDGKKGKVVLERPQRHSTTSGVDVVPSKKRTWTVSDKDDGRTHRGGRKHNKSEKMRSKRPKAMGTGVNAIPVG